ISAVSWPNAAHTPLAREAGRGRGPLRSNGRVRGIPVISFLPRRAARLLSRAALHRLGDRTKGPGAPHPPNADALGPSLSPLSRGEVYKAMPELICKDV